MNNSKASPVEWVRGRDPKVCSVCSESFKPGDMIFRVGCIATHATERCVDEFIEDCDLILANPKKGKVSNG